MQSLQNTSLPPEYNYLNCPFQTVDDFLHHSHLDQYIDIFLSEGFDSMTSLLEITEDDMTVMNVKRGHRRLIQREIATIKGIPRDQPLITNMMGAKYHEILSNASPSVLKLEDSRRPTTNLTSNSNMLTSYDVIGLTSPRSMNSGIGSSTSGNSSSSGAMLNLRSTNNNISPPNNNTYHPSHHQNSITNNATNPSPSATSTSNSNYNIIEIQSQSMSSNDDNDSIDTNESVPTKRKYRRHAKPDRNAPVKPQSAYIMFSNDARAELKNKNLSFAEVAKIVGDQWKNLSPVKKQDYERMAMRSKDEYLAALDQYRQTPQYNRYKKYLDDFKQKQENANRMVGRARKRAKQPSPGSGSVADSSSNGNSNENGSSGSGSADAYGDKESVIRRQKITSEDKQATPPQPRTSTNRSSDSGYQSQSYYHQNNSNVNWNSKRSDHMMRGMLPIEFVQNITPEPLQKSLSKKQSSSEDDDVDNDEESYKRRSPRFSKTKKVV